MSISLGWWPEDHQIPNYTHPDWSIPYAAAAAIHYLSNLHFDTSSLSCVIVIVNESQLERLGLSLFFRMMSPHKNVAKQKFMSTGLVLYIDLCCQMWIIFYGESVDKYCFWKSLEFIMISYICCMKKLRFCSWKKAL